MASTRTTPDTGVEIKPVELYGDDGGVPSLATVQGAVDALSTTLKAQLVNSRQMYYTPNGWERVRTPTTFKTWSYAASTAETTIWTPAAGKKIRVLGMVVSAGASVTVTVRDGVGGTVLLNFNVSGTAPVVLDFRNGIVLSAADRPLTIQNSAAQTGVGTVWGTEE